MKVTVLIALGVLVLSAVSCPAEAKRRDNSSTQQEQQQQTQQFVDARMHETMSSIDRSLSTLVTLTRGGEPARKPAPIGWTVAGAASQPRPISIPDSLPRPAIVPMDAKILDQRVDIQWKGSAESLLSSFSHQLGFSFSKNSKFLAQTVRIDAKRVTVREALGIISKQLNGKADIRVSLSERQIQLLVR